MSTDGLRTVAVLGGSYGGHRAARILAAGLPSGWRVVLVDRNSHINHVYNLPRYAVLPGHEHKAFIPYDHLFNNSSDPTSSHRHKRLHGTITSLYPHHITYVPHTKASSNEIPEEEILHFDYAIYALGSHLPSPINLWEPCDTLSSSSELKPPACTDLQEDTHGANHTQQYRGMKQEAISWVRTRQQQIAASQDVLVVGGGALGIQFASDIAEVYPSKSVTLLHSRSRLLHKFDEALGEEAYQGLQEVGVQVVLGERLDVSSLNGDGTNDTGKRGTRLIRTMKGREIRADLVLLCTGQLPNTSLLRDMDSCTINPESGMVRVSRALQILALSEKAISIDDGDHGRALRSTSPTLCGSVPPSPVDTLVGVDHTFSAPMSTSSTVNEFLKAPADVSHDPNTSLYPHLFAIGDAADAFGAIKAGHTAYYQGEVAARNVIRLIKAYAGTREARLRGSTLDTSNGKLDSRGAREDTEETLELEEYEPSLPMIKVTLGLTKSAYEVAGVVGTKDDEIDDLGAEVAWRSYGYKVIDEEGMWI